MDDPRALFAPPGSSGKSTPIPPPLRPSGQGGGNKRTNLRLLLLTMQFRASTTMTMQSRTNAKIHVSPSHVVFPGTNDYIVTVSGLQDDIIGAVALLLEEICPRDEAEEGEAKPKIRLLVPNKTCGCIIGKDGETVKSLIAQSCADIQVLPLGVSNAASNDRVVTVTGNYANLLTAITLILRMLCKDTNYPHELTRPFSYGGILPLPSASAGNRTPQPRGTILLPANQGSQITGAHGGYKRMQHNSSPRVAMSQLANPSSYITGAHGGYGQMQHNSHLSQVIAVSDSKMGMLMGHARSNLNAIEKATSATIKISDRGDFIPRTLDRKVTVTARTKEALDAAVSRITQQVTGSFYLVSDS